MALWTVAYKVKEKQEVVCSLEGRAWQLQLLCGEISILKMLSPENRMDMYKYRILKFSLCFSKEALVSVQAPGSQLHFPGVSGGCSVWDKASLDTVHCMAAKGFQGMVSSP